MINHNNKVRGILILGLRGIHGLLVDVFICELTFLPEILYYNYLVQISHLFIRTCAIARLLNRKREKLSRNNSEAKWKCLTYPVNVLFIFK